MFSTLIRCLDNEMTPFMKNEMAGLNKELAGYKIPKGSYFDQDEDDDRLDTLENDDYDYDDMNYKEENPIEVDMEKIRDDEDMDMESRFKV